MDFNIYGAPPTPPGLGLDAFQAGIGRAAQITANQTSAFAGLQAVAQDYMRFKNQQLLQERHEEAENARFRQTMARQKSEADRNFGFASKEADRRQSNVESDNARADVQLDLSRESSERANFAQQQQFADQERMRMQQEAQDRGRQAFMAAAAQALQQNQAGGGAPQQGPGVGPQLMQSQPLPMPPGMEGVFPQGLQTQSVNPGGFMSLMSQFQQPAQAAPGGMGPPQPGMEVTPQASQEVMGMLQGGGQAAEQAKLYNSMAPLIYAQQGSGGAASAKAEAKAAQEAAEIADFQRRLGRPTAISADDFKVFGGRLDPAVSGILGRESGDRGNPLYFYEGDEGPTVIGGATPRDAKAIQDYLRSMSGSTDMDLPYDQFLGGIGSRGTYSPAKAGEMGAKLRGRPKDSEQLQQAPQGQQAAPQPQGAPQQAPAAQPQQQQQAELQRPAQSPAAESFDRYFMGSAGSKEGVKATRAEAAQRADLARDEGDARRALTDAEKALKSAQNTGNARAAQAAGQQLKAMRKRLDALLEGKKKP